MLRPNRGQQGFGQGEMRRRQGQRRHLGGFEVWTGQLIALAVLLPYLRRLRQMPASPVPKHP